MQQVVSVGIAGTLEQLHQRLDTHFRALAESRKAVDAPVFALEHGLDDTDLGNLQATVRAAVEQGFGTKYRKWWLPFVVYAAESGYGYVGDEYWQTFADQTPRWDEAGVGDRDWIRYKFINFAEQYGGLKPKGAFADHFPIIAWPITHAVLPIYLQRNLAQLLYDFRTGLTSDLLNDPETLGARLASRAGSYTERFRVFCENTSLLGSVAVALLGEGNASPYLLPSTQRRLVDDLSREQESRHWLKSARQTASQVRAKGFAAPARDASFARTSSAGAISSPRVDPKLRLRRRDGKWQLWAFLPDLSSLNMSLGQAADELRGRNAVVQGIGGMLPTDMHLRSGQMKRLKHWPSTDAPFMQLKGVSAEVNALIAAQCAVDSGPAWLFRLRAPELADEVKGRVIRPGRKYMVVQKEGASPLQLAWAKEVSLELTGVRAAILDVPSLLSDTDRSALVAAGLAVVTDFSVQPVGFVASSWDGEGEMEWLAGESAAIAIASDIAPLRCELRLDGSTCQIAWPEGQRQLLLQIANLAVGRHELTVGLVACDGTVAATEALFITIRDPQVRPESATAAEGVRMFASPSRPTLADLWDGHASLTIEGPPNASAKLQVSLRSETGSELAHIQCSAELPVSEAEWPAIAKHIRDDQKFRDAYDDAESVEITVWHAGIGFASLTCDRGFQPLRWKVNRQHGAFRANLIDRTGGSNTRVELFTVDDPLSPKQLDSDGIIAIPPLGGLLRATAGDFQQSIILPTQPTEVLHAGQLRPRVDTGNGNPQAIIIRLARAYRMWAEAERPGDPFGQYVQRCVLEAITREAVSSVTGTYWAAVENRFPDSEQAIDFLNQLRDAVGNTRQQRTLAEEISRALWQWSTPDSLLIGFDDLIEPTLGQRGLGGLPGASRFLLLLAGRLDGILEWDEAERGKILDAVVVSPVLLRAARFAVLGSRAFIEAAEAAKGF